VTLIAALMREGATLAISDAMLTADGPAHVDSPLPTLALPNEEDVVAFGGFHVAGMCRKIFPITPQIWFGFFGKVVEVEEPLARFRRICRPGLSSAAEVRGWFEAANFDAMVESGCVVFARVVEGEVMFCRRVRHFERHDGQSLDVWAGTGSDHFQREYERSPSVQPSAGASKLLAFGLMLTGKMLVLQHRGKLLLKDEFGGAFELAFSGVDGLENVSNIMYVHRICWLNGEVDDRHVPASQIISERGIRHMTNAIWFVTHDRDRTIVARSLPEGLDGFVVYPPDRPHTAPPEQFGGVTHVVEVLVKLPEGRIVPSVVPAADYAFEVRGQSAEIRIPPHLPDEVLTYLLGGAS
jgi:hypothetical protein